jgi:hypothetical protein
MTVALEAKAQDLVIALTHLPDLRPAVQQSILVARRLDEVLEGASRRFRQAHSTVQSEVQAWEAQVLQQRLDRRHLGHRAAAVVEYLANVVAALADAELQHDGVTEREIDLARARLRGAVVHEAAPYEVPAAAHVRSIAAVTR